MAAPLGTHDPVPQVDLVGLLVRHRRKQAHTRGRRPHERGTPLDRRERVPPRDHHRPDGREVLIDESLLEEGPERALYREFRGIQAQPIENVISRLRPKIDLFFDKVLVNAPDPLVRQNRLTLLQTLLAEFSTMADFSEIVTNS